MPALTDPPFGSVWRYVKTGALVLVVAPDPKRRRVNGFKCLYLGSTARTDVGGYWMARMTAGEDVLLDYAAFPGSALPEVVDENWERVL
jgi:hypothetical protein